MNGYLRKQLSAGLLSISFLFGWLPLNQQYVPTNEETKTALTEYFNAKEDSQPSNETKRKVERDLAYLTKKAFRELTDKNVNTSFLITDNMPFIVWIGTRDSMRVVREMICKKEKIQKLEKKYNRSTPEHFISPSVWDSCMYFQQPAGLAERPLKINSEVDNVSQLTLFVAHESTHNLLSKYKLHNGYWKDEKIKIIEESACEIIGREISDYILKELNLERINNPLYLKAKELNRQERMNFFSGLSDSVQTLLAHKNVKEAETMIHNTWYRNEVGLALYERYYRSGKSDNSIGGRVYNIRQNCSSLKEFIEKIGNIKSYDEFEKLAK